MISRQRYFSRISYLVHSITLHPTQIAEHLKKSEAELTELLSEYWKLRHETGTLFPVKPITLADVHQQRCIWKHLPTSSI